MINPAKAAARLPSAKAAARLPPAKTTAVSLRGTLVHISVADTPNNGSVAPNHGRESPVRGVRVWRVRVGRVE